jgi:hypothetical protein
MSQDVPTNDASMRNANMNLNDYEGGGDVNIDSMGYYQKGGIVGKDLPNLMPEADPIPDKPLGPPIGTEGEWEIMHPVQPGDHVDNPEADPRPDEPLGPPKFDFKTGGIVEKNQPQQFKTGGVVRKNQPMEYAQGGKVKNNKLDTHDMMGQIEGKIYKMKKGGKVEKKKAAEKLALKALNRPERIKKVKKANIKAKLREGKEKYKVPKKYDVTGVVKDIKKVKKK